MDKHKIIKVEIRKGIDGHEVKALLALYADNKEYLLNCRDYYQVSVRLDQLKLELFKFMQMYAPKKAIKNVKVSLNDFEEYQE